MTLGSRLRNDGMTLSSNESLIHATHVYLHFNTQGNKVSQQELEITFNLEISYKFTRSNCKVSMIHYKLSNVLICVLRFLLASPLYSSAPLLPSPGFEDFPTL